MTAPADRCAALGGAGRITAVIDRTCMLDWAGVIPGYIVTRHARARVVVAVGDATT
jgi:hypothetical protein